MQLSLSLSRNALCCVAALTLYASSTAYAADPLSTSAALLESEAALGAVEGTAVLSEGSAVATGSSSLAGDAAMFADDSVTLVTRAAPVAESAGWRTVAGGLARKVGARFLGPAGMVVGAAELGKFLGEEGREAYDFYVAEWDSWQAERRHEAVMAAIDGIADEGEPGQGFGIVIAPGADGRESVTTPGLADVNALMPAANPLGVVSTPAVLDSEAAVVVASEKNQDARDLNPGDTLGLVYRIIGEAGDSGLTVRQITIRANQQRKAAGLSPLTQREIGLTVVVLVGEDTGVRLK